MSTVFEVLKQVGVALLANAKPLLELGASLLGLAERKRERSSLIPDEDAIRGEPGEPAEPRPDRVAAPGGRFSFVHPDWIPSCDRDLYVSRIARVRDREPLPSLAHARVGDMVMALIDCPKGREQNCSPIVGRVVLPKRDSFRIRLDWVPDRESPHGLAPGGWLDIPHAAVLVALPITAAGIRENEKRKRA